MTVENLRFCHKSHCREKRQWPAMAETEQRGRVILSVGAEQMVKGNMLQTVRTVTVVNDATVLAVHDILNV